MDAELKAAMRKLIADKGRKMEDPDDPSIYGWTDYNAWDHTREGKCRWIVPEGAIVNEETLAMFEGTFTDCKDEVGLNVAGCRCACGKYEDATLRVVTSLGEAIRALLGYDPAERVEL
ncbi:hypothetical protein SEA_BOBBY_179 [Mycobacterium phage Bobby]|nr:hypothetical protein SEA_BOBBY_179 [Mycobacterium phage Bobby]